MKKIYLSLVSFSISFLYSMNESIEVMLANNQKKVLTKKQLRRLTQSSRMLKNAAQDLNDEKQLPTYFPCIEDPKALTHVIDLLNDDGTPAAERCLSQTKEDWYKIAPALAALDIEGLNAYLLFTLENVYNSAPFCHELLYNASERSFSGGTLPAPFKDELERRINQKNIDTLLDGEALSKYYYLTKTISAAENISSGTLTSDGKTLVSIGYDIEDFCSDAVMNLTFGSLLRRTFVGNSNWVTAVAITPDGQILISGSTNGTLKLWDLQSGSLLRILKGHNHSVTALAITPDGKTLVSGSHRTLKFWYLSSDIFPFIPAGTFRKTLEVYDSGINAVAISPDGQTLVFGSDDGIKLWDLPSDWFRRALCSHENAHNACVRSLAITPDGKILVSGSSDKTIKLWDLKTGLVLKTLQGHDDSVRAVAITSDGQTLVSGSQDKTIKIWNLSTGELFKTLEGHKNWVSAVALFSDGQTLVSGSTDNTIKLWDLNTFELIRTLEGHQQGVSAVAVTPDGKTIISGSADNTLKLWALSDLKKCLLQTPLEQALVIQTLRNRTNLKELFQLTGKADEHFKQLDHGVQHFLGKKLHIQY